jgi:hypothetical protein
VPGRSFPSPAPARIMPAMSRAPDPPPSPWPRRVALAALATPVLVLVVPLFVASDNVHSVEESTAFVRLVLPLFALQGGGFWPDPNFPLGTCSVFALPHLLGLDPVLFGRLHALGWATVATVVAARLFGRFLGPLRGALAGASLWVVPAFVRGAVVSGEEAPCAALLLIGLAGLVAVSEGSAGRSAGGTWRLTIVSGLAAGSVVLFRLDALVVVPLLALLALPLLGLRRGLAFGAAASLAPALHLVHSARVYGDPLHFARQVMVVARASRGDAVTDAGGVPIQLMGELGFVVAPLAALGAIVLWRRGGPGRAVVAMACGATLAWWLMGAAGAFEPRFVRYLVPALVLWPPLAVAGASALLERFAATGGRRGTVAIALLVGLLLFGCGVRAWGDAREARLRPGVREVAAWLAEEGPRERILFDRASDEILILAGLELSRIENIFTPDTGFPGAPPVSEQISRHGATRVVLVGESQGGRWFRAAGLGWQPIFEQGEVVVWAPPARAPATPGRARGSRATPPASDP